MQLLDKDLFIKIKGHIDRRIIHHDCYIVIIQQLDSKQTLYKL